VTIRFGLERRWANRPGAVERTKAALRARQTAPESPPAPTPPNDRIRFLEDEPRTCQSCGTVSYITRMDSGWTCYTCGRVNGVGP